MTIQIDHAESFHRLRVKGEPRVLFNVWDAGTANVVAEAGARAIATGSNAGLRGPLFALVYAQEWQCWDGFVTATLSVTCSVRCTPRGFDALSPNGVRTKLA